MRPNRHPERADAVDRSTVSARASRAAIPVSGRTNRSASTGGTPCTLRTPRSARCDPEWQSARWRPRRDRGWRAPPYSARTRAPARRGFSRVVRSHSWPTHQRLVRRVSTHACASPRARSSASSRLVKLRSASGSRSSRVRVRGPSSQSACAWAIHTPGRRSNEHARRRYPLYRICRIDGRSPGLTPSDPSRPPPDRGRSIDIRTSPGRERFQPDPW